MRKPPVRTSQGTLSFYDHGKQAQIVIPGAVRSGISLKLTSISISPYVDFNMMIPPKHEFFHRRAQNTRESLTREIATAQIVKSRVKI